MMYNYGNIPLQHHQQNHGTQNMSRPSPPQPTWNVPHSHATYYSMQKPPSAVSREESQRMLARSDITNSHSPALSNATYRPTISAPEGLGTTDYFPGVIDTSMHCISLNSDMVD